ncbi:MAG: HIT family protein [bacterium]|nr:HIT family protein [bacterium]
MCIFCQIVAGEIPAHTIYQDEDTLAFLDINPRAPGHTMIIPKEHHSTILDLPDKLVAPIFGTTQKVTAMLEKGLGTNHFTIGINMGRLSGQEVDHLHIHVVPRFEGDNGGSIHSVVNNPPEESLEEIKEKIIQANGN